MPKSFIKQNWQWFVGFTLATVANVFLMGAAYKGVTEEAKNLRDDLNDLKPQVNTNTNAITDLKVGIAEIRTDVKWLRQQKEAEKNDTAQARGK